MFTSCRLSALVVIILCGLLCCGCGKKTQPVESTESESTDSSSGEGESTATAKAAKPTAVKPDEVWFENPLKIAGEKTPVGGGTTPAIATATPATTATPVTTAAPPPSGDTPAAASGGNGWESLITGDIIANEIKQIRIDMKDLLSTEGKYNGAYKKLIPMNMSVLGALATIGATHPDNLSWKPDAKFIRELATDVQSKANGLGKAPYETTIKAWEVEDAMLSGNKPPMLPEAAAALPFPEFVKRGPAMLRMDRANTFMLEKITSAEALKKEQEKLLHETAMLATVTRVIGSDGFTDAEAEEYQGYVKDMEAACKQMTEGAKAGDFAAVTDAKEKIKQACEKCHANFKG